MFTVFDFSVLVKLFLYLSITNVNTLRYPPFIFSRLILFGECFAILMFAKVREGLQAVVMFTIFVLTTILSLLPYTIALPSSPSLPRTPQHNLSKRLISVSPGLVRTPVAR